MEKCLRVSWVTHPGRSQRLYTQWEAVGGPCWSFGLILCWCKVYLGAGHQVHHKGNVGFEVYFDHLISIFLCNSKLHTRQFLWSSVGYTDCVGFTATRLTKSQILGLWGFLFFSSKLFQGCEAGWSSSLPKTFHVEYQGYVLINVCRNYGRYGLLTTQKWALQGKTAPDKD